jgi:hypothetical protein
MNLGQRLKQKGQQQAFDYAGERFKNEVMPALREWLRVRKKFGYHEFKFEEFRAYCERVDLIPSSPNAWGALPKMAVNYGLIIPTDRYEKATTARTRNHPVKIWAVV